MRVDANSLLFALSGALDCVEREIFGVTTNHSKRVALVAARLCAHMGLAPSAVFDMISCAILHDNALTEYTLRVGRSAVNCRKNIEMHCVSGETQASFFPFQGDVQNVILHHHENWNGSGFFAVKGQQIALRAATLRLADNADLLLGGMGQGERGLVCELVRAHVSEERETVYHPDVVDAFLQLCDEDFVSDLADESIDGSLARHTPVMPNHLSLEEVHRACELFSGITDAKSPFTSNHTRSLCARTAQMAVVYNLGYEHTLKLCIAAHLHDVGKLVIPPEILEKPAPLTAEEFAVMKGHVLATNQLLQKVPGLTEVTQWAGQHHEKLDGSGYPYGLTADQLGFEGRLLACLDIYQALIEDRPYRKGMSHEDAISILRKMALQGKLDADMVDTIGASLGAVSK